MPKTGFYTVKITQNTIIQHVKTLNALNAYHQKQAIMSSFAFDCVSLWHVF